MLTTSGILHLTLASILFNSKYTAANHLTTENVNVSQLENHSVHPDNMFPFIPQVTSIRDVAVEIMEEQEEEQEVDEFFENFNENDMVEEESIEKIIENLEGMVQTQANVSQPDLMLQTMGHNNTEQAGVAHLDMGQVPTNHTNVDLANISQEDGILGANFTPELVGKLELAC